MKIKYNYENNKNNSKYLYYHSFHRVATNMNFNVTNTDLLK